MNNPPSFDTWTSLFLFAALQGLFVSLALILLRKKMLVPNLLLASLLFLYSLTLLEYVFYWTGYLIDYPHLMALSSNFPYLFGPILYFYFRFVFEKSFFRRSDLLHLLPFLLTSLWMSPMYLASADTKVLYMTGKAQPSVLFHFFGLLRYLPGAAWFKVASMSAYLFVILKKYYPISKGNAEVTTWLISLCALFAGFILSYASYFVLVNFSFFNNEWDYMISFSMLFTICFISWFGYLQQKVFSGFSLQEAIVVQEKYKNSPIDEEMGVLLEQQLDALMASKKLYRQSDLRLGKLAEEMGTGKHYLSQVINERKGMSFFEYINELRVKEAAELLSKKSKEELQVIEIAYQVGFNNKVSFNSSFKKVIGKTPTNFRKEFIEAD